MLPVSVFPEVGEKKRCDILTRPSPVAQGVLFNGG